MFKKKILSLVRLTSKTISLITGRDVKVRVTDEKDPALGYTDNNAVYVNPEHHLIKEAIRKISTKRAVAVLAGVIAHELMHMLLTNFEYTKKVCGTNNKMFKISNLCEDPAIEYFAPRYIGGWFLDALYASISFIFAETPNIETGKSTWDQIEIAMIQYGDMGFLKGKFTDVEAEKRWRMLYPLFDQCIHEPNGERRIDLAKEIYFIVDDIMPDVPPEEVSEMKRSSGTGEEAKEGDGDEGTGDATAMGSSDSMSSKTEARRKSLKEKLSGIGSTPEYDPLSGPSSGKDDAKKEDSKGDGGSKESEDSSDEEKEDDSKDGSSDSSDSSEGDSLADALDKELESEESDLEGFTEEEMDELLDTIDSLMAESDREVDAKKVAEIEAAIDSVTIDKAPHQPTVFGPNEFNVTDGDREHYLQIKRHYQGQINRLKKTFNDIFSKEEDLSEATFYGNLNVMRFAMDKGPRYFDKKFEGVDRNDTAVIILVDESGSTGCIMEQERASVIMLVEALEKNVKALSVIGFSAEETIRGMRQPTGMADMRHYINWKVTEKSKARLMHMRARCENYDGASIRYAVQLMKKRQEKNKLLIIISDGAPACNYYYTGKANGVADTKQAILEARKNCDVLGIAIGNASTEVIYSMYGSDFLHVANPGEVATRIIPKLKGKIKNWD